MGQRLIALASEDHVLHVGAALENPGHPRLGQDAGEIAGLSKMGVPLVSALPAAQQLNVLIDFSAPEGTMNVLQTCIARRIPLVVATTGHTAEQRRAIEEAAHDTALLMSPNM